MSSKNAQIVAAQSVEWLAADQELFQSFLDITGFCVADMQLEVENVEFQTAVLDFLMMEDSRVIAFCDAFRIQYEEIAKLRAQLPGGDLPHWS